MAMNKIYPNPTVLACSTQSVHELSNSKDKELWYINQDIYHVHTNIRKQILKILHSFYNT